MGMVEDGASLAHDFVGSLGPRWRHVQAVARRAEECIPAVEPSEGAMLDAAAWLHDIGYAPTLADTGLHPLDGARFLVSSNWPERVINLVAHHSGARYEARERGLSAELEAFPFRDDGLSDALATADLTTGPSGLPVSFDDRVNEILERYGSEHPVHRAWLVARPVLALAVERTEARLALSL